jgi:hypothetical protein
VGTRSLARDLASTMLFAIRTGFGQRHFRFGTKVFRLQLLASALRMSFTTARQDETVEPNDYRSRTGLKARAIAGRRQMRYDGRDVTLTLIACQEGKLVNAHFAA